MNRVLASGPKAQAVVARGVILGVADNEIDRRLVFEIGRVAPTQQISAASSADQISGLCLHANPLVIVLDIQLLGPAPLDGQLEKFMAKAPVILFGGPKRQTEFAHLLASDRLDFVGRCGDFIPLVVSLFQRRLRFSEMSKDSAVSTWPGAPPDIATIFRHEINNPLTGILGNAELVLAHSDRISAVDKQRLQTVVNLAVRLRETIRRVSNSLETEHSSAQSA